MISSLNKKVHFNDISDDEDNKLRLIANLLLQTESQLEVKELKELGKYINDYLDHKCLIDHFFWERAIPFYVRDNDKRRAYLNMLSERFT